MIIFLKNETKQFCFPLAIKPYFAISLSVDSLFIFLMVSFDEQKILTAEKSSFFSFIKVRAFCFLSKKFLPTQLFAFIFYWK